jgi:TPR repeat protein
VQYWLWNYGPSVIRQQLALKRELTRLGYYPSPLDDYFVREATEQALLLTADGAPLSIAMPSFIRHMKTEVAGGIDGAVQAKGKRGYPIDWLVKAHLGDADAQYRRGFVYYNGHGHGVRTRQNRREALWWFRKAANQGHGEAQLQTGTMYLLGEGTHQDFREAHRWLNLAADNQSLDDNGHKKAVYYCGLAASRSR